MNSKYNRKILRNNLNKNVLNLYKENLRYLNLQSRPEDVERLPL